MVKIIFFFVAIALFGSCNNPDSPAEKTKDISVTDASLKIIPSPADTASAEPYLFTDSNGLVYLSWIEKAKGSSYLNFSVLKNEQWSTPQLISSGDNWFVNWADYPLLASDGANNMVAHFLEKSETGAYTYDVKIINSADKGKTWSSSRILHDDGKKAEHGFVSMVPYGNNFFIAWLDGRNAAMEAKEGHAGGHGGHHGQMTLRAAIVDKLGNKISEWELDDRVCDCCQTSAVITSNGPVVFYRDRSENEIRDISFVRFVNGTWTKPLSVYSDNWNIDGCPVNGPRADALGNSLALAWFTSPDKNAQVNLAFSTDAGASFSAPVRIDEGKAIGRVDIVMLDEKTAMVTWMEGAVIKAAKVHSDGSKGSAVIISSSSESRSSGFPQMTRSGNQVIFAWTDDKDKTIRTARIVL
jgi:hypothetical protein